MGFIESVYQSKMPLSLHISYSGVTFFALEENGLTGSSVRLKYFSHFIQPLGMNEFITRLFRTLSSHKADKTLRKPFLIPLRWHLVIDSTKIEKKRFVIYLPILKIVIDPRSY